MELFLERRHIGKETEEDTNLGNLKIVGYYTLIALFGMFLAGYAINYLSLSIPAQLTGSDAVLYSVLIGIAEAQFFQGFILDWMLTTLSQPAFALAGAAGVATVYHFARYGTQTNALVYVFVGFFIMNWACYKSKRVSPAMLSHALNNLFALLRVV